MVTKLNTLALFSGIGGIELAFERQGFLIDAQCEIDSRCREVLSKHFPGTPCHEDVRGIHGKDFSGIEVIVGGFPCQDISVAGERAGLGGSRSILWFEYERILREIRPRWCLIENVGGLLSSNRGGDLGAILGSLGDMGYGFAYRLLDAQWFGVPQRRRRVFIVGCLGDAGRAAQVLLEPESGGGNPPPRGEAQQIASALTKSCLGGGGVDDNNAQANHIVAQCHGTNVGPMGTLRRGSGSVGGGVPFVAFHVTQDPITSEDRWPTLSTGNSQGCATLGVAGAVGVRKLTPTECERLQGFPDGWTEGHADAPRYRMLGNAVAVPVVEWIANRMKAAW